MKKIINESTLKKIIAESLKEYLNEIGDTPAGFLAIKNAQAKADKAGRYSQADRFRDYAGMKDNFPIAEDFSIDGIKRLHMLAATITPAAKPVRALCMV